MHYQKEHKTAGTGLYYAIITQDLQILAISKQKCKMRWK
jgi:hypothetical protein